VDPKHDDRLVQQIVINTATLARLTIDGQLVPLAVMAGLTGAARRPAALSDTSPVVVARPEQWASVADGTTHPSATAAHQYARYHGGVAVAEVDAAAPVNLAGV
jgi:hypothetical protein